MQQSTRNSLRIGAAVLIAVLVISAVISATQIRQLYEQSEWLAHSHELYGKLEMLISTMKDAETGQRGYLLTGDRSYLAPYELAKQHIDGQIDRIDSLTADNKTQQLRVPVIRELVGKKLAELAETISLRDKEDVDGALAIVKSGRGRQSMIDLRRAVDQMQKEEQRLLVERRASSRSALAAALATVAASAVAGIGALTGFLWLLHRHMEATRVASRTMHDQKELLSATLTSIGDGVIATDRDGHVTFMNPVAERLTGWNSKHAAGRPLEMVFNIVNEVTRQKVENPAMRALREGSIVGLANHTVLLAYDGREWPIDDSAAPIRNLIGDIHGSILVFREISHRKQQEADLREQSEQLREADRRKTEFLATLAHELRNPLAPISNALHVWPLVEKDEGQTDRLRETVARQMQQLVRLVDDLMDVSRITAGKIELEKQTVSLGTIVGGAIETVKPLCDSLDQQVKVNLPDPPILIEADVARVTQVFGNILHNASKYAGPKGVITVTVERERDRAVVRFRDNGTGIPPEMLTEIFEMFRQVDSSLSRASGGLGIGLTLVKRLVESHGGTVEARSEGLGKGTEIVVTLPALRSTMPRGEAAPRRPKIDSTFPRHKVLVVDDVVDSARTLLLLLRAMGQEVEMRHDGPTAIEWAIEHKPDIALLDISMPGMDGYEVAERLRSVPELAKVTLVALTGYGQDSDRLRSSEAGFNMHLVKPISMDSIHDLLRAPRSDNALSI